MRRPPEPTDPVDRALLPHWRALERAIGPLELFDAHTHIGFADPDGYRQSAPELLEALAPVGAKAAVFPMHEPDGYPAPNDAVLAAAGAAPDRLVAYCRVDPRLGYDAVREAERCLDAGARGIKLHPRAEAFTLAEPSVDRLVALANERRVPVLIHAGRGIPALGEHSIALTGRYPRASLILAHAAVSDLAWIHRAMDSHPNLFVDTSWWSPGDMLALYRLVPSAQILWGSDSPYGTPLAAALAHLRFAVQAGVFSEAIRSIAGGQMKRILECRPLLRFGRAPGEIERPGPHHERVVSHLLAAIGAALTLGDREEAVSLALLACDVPDDDPAAPLLGEVRRLIELSRRLAPEEPPEPRYPSSVRLLVAAMTMARTPAAPI